MEWHDFNQRYREIHPESTRGDRRRAFEAFQAKRLDLVEVRRLFGIRPEESLIRSSDESVVLLANLGFQRRVERAINS